MVDLVLQEVRRLYRAGADKGGPKFEDRLQLFQCRLRTQGVQEPNLFVGEGQECRRLAQMQSQHLGRGGVHRELVYFLWIWSTPVGDEDAVLRELLAVDTALHGLTFGGQYRCPFGIEDEEIHVDEALHVLDVLEVFDGCDERTRVTLLADERVVDAGQAEQLGGVSAGHKSGEGRLRATSTGDGAHGEASE